MCPIWGRKRAPAHGLRAKRTRRSAMARRADCESPGKLRTRRLSRCPPPESRGGGCKHSFVQVKRIASCGASGSSCRTAPAGRRAPRGTGRARGNSPKAGVGSLEVTLPRRLARPWPGSRNSCPAPPLDQAWVLEPEWHARCKRPDLKIRVRLPPLKLSGRANWSPYEPPTLRRSQGNEPGSPADVLLHDQLSALQPHGNRAREQSGL